MRLGRRVLAVVVLLALGAYALRSVPLWSRALLARGLTNRQIATELVLSEKTVKTHVSNILGKLGLPDRTQAALYAVRLGL